MKTEKEIRKEILIQIDELSMDTSKLENYNTIGWLKCLVWMLQK